MIGLLLIYFIGKYFYDLAGQYKKSKWGFAILGVISYYLGILIGGAVIGLLFEFVLEIPVEGFSDIALGLMSIPMGILACWGFYKLLKSQWTKPSVSSSSDVLDKDLIQRD
jgi:hypothetical protein